MKVSFYQRGNTIYTRVHHKKDQIRVTTGIKFPAHVKFIESRQEFKSDTPEAASLNSELYRQRVLINDLFSKYGDVEKVKQYYMQPAVEIEVEEKESYRLDDLVDEYCRRIGNGKIKTRRKALYKETSVRAYQYIANTYRKFTAEHETIDLDMLDLTGKDMKEKKIIADRLNAHFDKVVKWMIDNRYSINSRGDVNNVLALIIKYWEGEFFMHFPKISRLEYVEVPIITVPQDFAIAFVNDKHKLYDKMNSRYKYIWELCATMFVTSLRISDAITLTKEDISIVDDEVYFVKENKKTGADTTLPLPKALISRYIYNINHYGKLYTPTSLKNPGAYAKRTFKEFFSQYPEMHEIINYKAIDYTGKKVNYSDKFYEIIHPHMLRKTAITMMIANGVSAEHVRFASGHKSRALERYIGHVEKTHKSQIHNFYKNTYDEDTEAA